MTDPLLEPIGALPLPGSIGPNLPGLEVRIRAGRHQLPPRDTTYDVESAKGDGRTVQGSLLIMVPITPGRAGDLERLLAAIAFPPGGADLELNPVIPFRKLESVHFARILIHPVSPSAEAPIPEWKGTKQASGPPIAAKLLFSTDYDGALGDHLDELLREAGPGLDMLFSLCEGWPGHQDREAAHRFFVRNEIVSNTFYTGTQNRSVAQIRREAELRDVVEDYLDAYADTPGFPSDPVLIRQRVRDWIFEQKRLEWVKEQPGGFPRPLLPAFLTNKLIVTAVVAVAVLSAIAIATLQPFAGLRLSTALVIGALMLVVVAGLAGYGYLSHLAARDPVIIGDDVQERTARLVQTEDRIVQNEMSSVIYIKRPLWFRRLVLKTVLTFINLTARYLSNQGTLAGIPSIHFARWVIVDDGRRLLFFSNFDGSWENYLGDFIDKAHSGLTAVWSNCVGFPRTKGLVGMGATDEQLFKAYSRQSQVHTQVWYSAYRWLTVSNVNDNTRLRLGLYGEMNAEQAQDWLRMSVQRMATALPRPTRAAEPTVEIADIQGLIVRSYQPLKAAMYLPVMLDPQRQLEAKQWIGELTSVVTPASRSSASIANDGRALNIALTYSGFQALGVEQHGVQGFSREFKEGMATEHRQRLLGDTGPADPAAWSWGGPDTGIDAMLFVFADSSERLNAIRAEEEARCARYGVRLGKPLETASLPGDKEHFGFHDGIAQPRIAGLKSVGGTASAQSSTVAPGEVILGYPNAYGLMPMSATVPDAPVSRPFLAPAPEDPGQSGLMPRRDLGRNGSYVVFRQLRQDVRAFWEYIDRRAGSDPERRKWLGAKMVGRWPNGAPLVRYPDREPESFDETTANDFWYKSDLAGDRCPVGAHIRRSNPRDGLFPDRADSLLVADRHRLLRRGRAYGRPLAASFDPQDILNGPGDGVDRGLHFICFNTDIARQFEFVQSTWVNNMKFDGLYADRDPVAAPHVDAAAARHDEEVGQFTIQSCSVRHRVSRLPPFVRMVGGAYLFMPGLKTLEFLAQT